MVKTCESCQTRVLFVDDRCPSCGAPKEAAKQAAESTPSDLEKYHDIIFDGLWDKLEEEQIVANLEKAGCPTDFAKRLLLEEQQKKIEEAKQRARERMRNGWIVATLGAAVTVGTFLSASASGGVYVVTWGAILFGLSEVLRANGELNGGY